MNRSLLALGVVLFAFLTLGLCRNTASSFDSERINCRPSFTAPLGCTPEGEDTWAVAARAVFRSLWLASLTLLFALAVGISAGSILAFSSSSKAAILVLWMMEALLVVPPFLGYILALAIIKPTGSFGYALSLGLFAWPSIARLTAPEMKKISASSWFLAFQNEGASPLILVKQTLPHLIPTLAAASLLALPGLLTAEATLAFLGAATGTADTLGSMMSNAKTAFNDPSQGFHFFAVTLGSFLALMLFLFGCSEAFSKQSDPRRRGGR